LIKVLVVDDEALLRSAFSSLIEAQDDLEVVGAAADGRQAAELAASLAPDVVVMDVRMPVMDGIEATRRITRDPDSGPRVLILTTFDLDEYVFEALRAGASGFALKSRPPEELLSGIRTVAAGEALLAPSVTRRLIAHFTDRTTAAARTPRGLNELTDREREVLVLVARGLSNAELAATLHVTLPTAKTHVSRILTKLGARDRTQLVILAYESGVVTRLADPLCQGSWCTLPCRIRRHASRDFKASAPRRRAPAVQRATTPRPCHGVSGRLFTPIVAWASRPADMGPICCRCRAILASELRDATIGNRYSKPSTSPMAAAESRTAAATPRLSRAMSVRYKTAPTTARRSAPAVRDAYPCPGVNPRPGRISHPMTAEAATASSEAMSIGTASTAALAKSNVSRRGTAVSDSLIIPVLYSFPMASTPATATTAWPR
jgi:DNA-binding NarL/FixJ family response regulator